MLKPNPMCKVCQAVQADTKLEKDINSSSFFVKSARRTLLDIHRDHEGQFSYRALRMHTGRHQTLSAVQIRNKNQRAILKQKKAEQEITNVKETTVWDEVIKTGMTKLKSGELEMRTADLLKAAKDKSDYGLKVKDQEMQMAEMVAYFASGEGDIMESKKYDRRIIEGQTGEDYDPTEQLTADIGRRQDESRAFYQSIIGDAPTPGTD
jgi:hypothetical protein